MSPFPWIDEVGGKGDGIALYGDTKSMDERKPLVRTNILQIG